MPNKKLTVNQQRVLVAKDILKQLKARRYVANARAQTIDDDLRSVLNVTDNRVSAQEVLKNREKCGVCAAGACLLAYVERFNNVTVGELYARGFTKTMRHIPGFGDCFSPELLAEIETLYERSSYGWNRDVLGDQVINKIQQRSREILDKNSDTRLAQIMRLLIKHRGSYVMFPGLKRVSS